MARNNTRPKCQPYGSSSKSSSKNTKAASPPPGASLGDPHAQPTTNAGSTASSLCRCITCCGSSGGIPASAKPAVVASKIPQSPIGERGCAERVTLPRHKDNNPQSRFLTSDPFVDLQRMDKYNTPNVNIDLLGPSVFFIGCEVSKLSREMRIPPLKKMTKPCHFLAEEMEDIPLCLEELDQKMMKNCDTSRMQAYHQHEGVPAREELEAIKNNT
ncbi:Uncharacterized protein Fot_35908 [Forsythia ovata]|uniref:Uncharacterized protein n=1 Tax=Forsythia ovata TaxID=205694 RepID=A0ABD1SMX0_9LAMI